MSDESAYYHTVEEHTPLVYHDNEDCPAGQNIKPKHWRGGKGTGRTLCKECVKLTAK
jgi:hypothetical protein